MWNTHKPDKFKKMRIAFIGDLQYWKAEIEELGRKMEQIKRFSPDLSIVMGDFGGSKMRSAEGLEETKEYVSRAGCPFHAIFGNHDVEYWPDNINAYDPEATYRGVFGCCPNRSFKINGVLVVCLSIERQPPETMITPYTVYISEQQYLWAKNDIESNRDMPCIIVAHAPVAGSGLRCDRPMHNAALDTYLDQTFEARRWVELLRDNPQIKVWVSAHFHLGHDYDTAITKRGGVVHISCGVVTCCTRDERCHTRIADITEDKRLLVYTLDHNNDDKLILDAEIDLTGKNEPLGRIAAPKEREVLLGDDEPVCVWYDPKDDIYYISTQKGMLWEYDMGLLDISGALSYENPVKELARTDKRLCMEFAAGGFGSVELGSRKRWQYKDSLPQELKKEEALTGEKLQKPTFIVTKAKEGRYIQIFG